MTPGRLAIAREAAARLAAAGDSRPRAARDPVNLPMIRNWTEALGGGDPDPETAPPAMIQVWTMPGLHGVRGDDDPLGQMSQVLDEAGYTSVVATNCDQTYHRYLKLGEQLSVRARLLDVAGPKRTALGEGWFVTTRSTWFSSGEPVATMDFRILKFRPAPSPADPASTETAHAPPGHPGHRVLLGGHRGRRAAHPALRGLRRAAPPARPDVPGLRHPRATAGTWSRPGPARCSATSCTTIRRCRARSLPLVVALVQLPEGVRMVGEMPGVAPTWSASACRSGPRSSVSTTTLTLPAWRPAEGMLPDRVIDVTPTFVISSALATRDFQDVHHDRDRAVARGAKDIFLNILTTTGLVQRYVCDWAGPDAVVRAISIRLGVPCHAGDTLTLTGQVTEDDGRRTGDRRHRPVPPRRPRHRHRADRPMLTPEINTAIVGIGATEFSKDSGRSELRLAAEAVRAALDDAALRPADVDGLVTFTMDTNAEIAVARELGIPELRFFGTIGYGGGAACATVHHAAMAVTTGAADVVVCYRALNERSGRRFGRVVTGAVTTPTTYGVDNGWHYPMGIATPAATVAMAARRYMHAYGATSEDFGRVTVADRRHAATNPHAWFYQRPVTLAEHQASRWIVEPLRLLDCCQESDGAVAVVVTSADRARDLPHRPAVIRAAAQGAGPDQFTMTSYYRDDLTGLPELGVVARQLWRQARIGPAEIRTAVLYDHFTPYVLMQLEELGFCGPGQARDFIADGAIEMGGRLPLNPHGGQLGEAYIHGMNGIAEAVRQVRGTAVNQVPGDGPVLVTAGTGVPTSGLILS